MTPTLQASLALFGLSSLHAVSEDDLRHIYHEKAQKAHPDRGGSSSEFIYLRACYTLLKKALLNKEFEDSTQTNEQEGQAKSSSPNQDTYIDMLKKEIDAYKTVYQKMSTVIDRYESIFNQQITIINSTNTSANAEIDKYNQDRIALKKNLDDQLAELEKKRNPTLWGTFMGNNGMDDESYILNYNHLVESYNKAVQDMDTEYLTSLIQEYQRGMSQVIDVMEV